MKRLGVVLVCLAGCDSNFQDRPASTRSRVEGCDRGVAVVAQHVGLFSISLALDTDSAGQVLAARGAFQTACDDDGCELHTEQAQSGWIMPEVVSADGLTRQAGRFHVEFDELSIEGDYDTESP